MVIASMSYSARPHAVAISVAKLQRRMWTHLFWALWAAGGTEAARIPLHPGDIPALPVFSAYENRTVQLANGLSLKVAEGVVKFAPPVSDKYSPHFFVLPSVASREEIASLMEVLKTGIEFDTDLDSIDGMTSWEFYLMTDELGQTLETNTLKGDADPAQAGSRRKVREAALAIVNPIVDDRIIPFVRQNYPEACNHTAERACRVCSSVVRQYLPGHRRTVAIHHDHEAIVTAVVSLSDYGSDYTGGLYVATSSKRTTIALSSGDAVVHTTDFEHGVSLNRQSERWSLVLWIRDSATCAPHNAEWHKDCANAGNPICQYLMAQVQQDPTRPDKLDNDRFREVLKWLEASAAGGYSPALSALGHVAINTGDLNKATHLFQTALSRGEDTNPHAAYSLAQIAVRRKNAGKAVELLELAARGGSEAAAFNLGMAHLQGWGVQRPDPLLAAEWFLACNMPEGLKFVSDWHEANGRHKQAARVLARARRMGFESPWRSTAMSRAKMGDVFEFWSSMRNGGQRTEHRHRRGKRQGTRREL